MIHVTGMAGSANFSDCEKYRYTLTRQWDQSLPGVAFVGVNPSTADASQDDPTIRRCVGFARASGFGSLVMLNLFCWRSTDVGGLSDATDPIGEEANRVLLEDTSAMLIWASGPAEKVPKRLRYRFDEVEKMLRARRPIYAIAFTKSGWPAHPLMLPAALKPVEWIR